MDKKFPYGYDVNAYIDKAFFIPASYLKLSWDEFLDKYLELVSPGPFYVGRKDLENCPGLKEFLGYK